MLAECTYVGGKEGALLGTRAEGGLGSPHACWFLEAVQMTVHRSQWTGKNKRIWGRVYRGGNFGLVTPMSVLEGIQITTRTAFLLMSIFKG